MPSQENPIRIPSIYILIIYLIYLIGEVGGLMGLMLGASVMTVCELVDLMLYNGVIKCVSRRKVGHKNDTAKVKQNDTDIREESMDSKPKNGMSSCSLIFIFNLFFVNISY